MHKFTQKRPRRLTRLCAAQRLALVGLATPLLVVAGTAVAHADTVVRGAKCEGDRVVRCLEIHYDTAGFFRAHALIFDNGGDSVDYNVDVTAVGAVADTPGGAHDVIDRARGTHYDCSDTGRVDYTVQALYQWRQIPGGPLTTGEITTTAEVC